MVTARRLLALLPAVLLLLPPGTASGKQAGSPFTSTNPRLETVVVAVPADLPCARAERTGARTSYLDCHSSGARHPDTPGGPEFLERYAEQLGLQVGLDNLQWVSEQNGLSGKTYRYIQALGNIPIDGAIDLDLERTNVEIDRWQIFLEPGDRLVFFTDGVTEALNAEDEEFGDEQLIEVTNACRGKTSP